MARPELHSNIDPEVFDSYYWYRSELEDFAKTLGLSKAGGKFEIHDRISHFLRTGEKLKPQCIQPTSTFNWAQEPLSVDTIITDSYKSNANVRAFFESYVGTSFAFSIDLMAFMKDNIGATLGDAIVYYKARQTAMKQGYKQQIADHNQFNLYTREFLADNPDLSRDDATTCWLATIEVARPKSKGRGIRYSSADLRFLDHN